MRPINDHLSAQIPRFEVRIDGSITPCVWPCECSCEGGWECVSALRCGCVRSSFGTAIYQLYTLSNYWSQAYGTLKPPQSFLASQRLFVLRINVMEEYVRAYVVYLLSGVFSHVPGCEKDHVNACRRIGDRLVNYINSKIK